MSQRTPEPTAPAGESGGAAPPRASAAVVLLRDGPAGAVEVFMVRRHARGTFPDVFVFPGGTVTEADRIAERLSSLCPAVTDGPALGGGYHAAAVRECFEEAGVLLARRAGTGLALHAGETARFAAHRAALHAGATDLAAVARAEALALDMHSLVHWAHWITPEGEARRFETHFFLAAMPAGQEALHDRLETTAGVWVTPAHALAGCARGEFPLVLPTRCQLGDLVGLASISAVFARFAGRVVRTIQPRLVGEGIVLDGGR